MHGRRMGLCGVLCGAIVLREESPTAATSVPLQDPTQHSRVGGQSGVFADHAYVLTSF